MERHMNEKHPGGKRGEDSVLAGLGRHLPTQGKGWFDRHYPYPASSFRRGVTGI